MAYPYDSGATKTFQASQGGVASTDPKLLKHKGIDPKLADKWKRVAPPPPGLSLATKRLGWELGYSFITKRQFRVVDTSVDRGIACWLDAGDAAPAVVVLYDGLLPVQQRDGGARGHALVACEHPTRGPDAASEERRRGARGLALGGPRPAAPRPPRGLLLAARRRPPAGRPFAEPRPRGKSLVLVDPMRSTPSRRTSRRRIRSSSGPPRLRHAPRQVQVRHGTGRRRRPRPQTSSGDVATTAELATELRSHLPSQDAFANSRASRSSRTSAT